jgi:hypothetical protein
MLSFAFDKVEDFKIYKNQIKSLASSALFQMNLSSTDTPYLQSISKPIFNSKDKVIVFTELEKVLLKVEPYFSKELQSVEQMD